MPDGIKIVLNGSVPPKKNSRNILVRKGRVINVPSSRYAQWEADCLWQAKGIKPVTGAPVALQATFYVADNRQRDLDNMLASIQDLLVKAGVLSSDSWQTLNPITINCAGVDRSNPRVEIVLNLNNELLEKEVF